MEIHRFEKGWFVLSVVLILMLVGTVVYGTVDNAAGVEGQGIKMVDDSGGTVDPDNLGATAFDEPGVRKTGPNSYDVYIVARQFYFNPGTPGTAEPIRVPAGSTVTFHVTSADVVHGFQVAGTNVNSMVIPGQVAELTAEFDEARSYGIVCHEYCGAGHHTMEGQIRVVPQAQYNASAATVNVDSANVDGDAAADGQEGSQ